MEPGVDPLPNVDLHDPTVSFCGSSTSPSLINSSLLETLSQSDSLEMADGDSGVPRSVFSNSGPYGDNQRKPRSSAFPSSLTWDSDSEKETFDEEELECFSNPHGLAAHSPGSPTCGQEQDRLACCVFQPPERLFEKDMASSLEGRDQGSNKSYKEIFMTQPSTQPPERDNAGSVSDQTCALFSDAKPNEECQQEGGEEKGFDQKKEEKKSVPERDVYTFPGDSDPESPPPGPWAHCTFVQRRRKKRALLRPFSGLSPWQRTTGACRKTRVAPSRAKERGKRANDDEGVFEFKEEEDEKLQAKENPKGLCQEIFTCVECSIYFKKRAHLREHMREHGQDAGRKGQRGSEGVGRRRAKKSVFECMECGQQFTDRLLLVNHHRQHQELRRKVLEEIGKLNEGGKQALGQTRRRKPRRVKKSSPTCGQFVCLKCNYSSDVPQELADHAKTHTRTKATVSRTSPRFQQKSRKKGQTRASRSSSTSSLATSAPAERYPTRSSMQTVEEPPKAESLQQNALELEGEADADPLPGTSQNQPVPTTPAEATDHPVVDSAKPDQPDPAPPVGLSPKEPSKSPQDSPAAEDGQNPHSPDADPPSSTPKCRAQRRTVVLKATGKRRTKRVPREALRRTRASSRLSGQPDSSNSAEAIDTTDQTQNTEPMTEQNQTEPEPEPVQEPEPEPEVEPKMTTKKDRLEAPALALQLKHSFSASLRGSTERLALTEGQQAQLRLMLPLVLLNTISSEVQTSFSYTRLMGDQSPAPAPDLQTSHQKPSIELKGGVNEETPVDDQDEEKRREDTTEPKPDQHVSEKEEEEGDDEEEEEDVVNRLLHALDEEEEEEEDEEGVSVKSMGRKCPYCPERFDNGIGLANHIRGHLNRVGVSYNVRHFISPEEVNAIEKKFSFQKKKKKVANFDPATFSVMRCEFCSAGFDTRAGLSSHARAHLRDFGITNWEVTVSPINVLRELFSKHPDLSVPTGPRFSPEGRETEPDEERDEPGFQDEEEGVSSDVVPQVPEPTSQPWKMEENDAGEPQGGEEEDEDEEGGVMKMPLLDDFPSSPGTIGAVPSEPGGPEPADDTESKGSSVLTCEVCSAQFDSQHALASHARSHLSPQLDGDVSENGDAPLDLLYHIAKDPDHDSNLPPPPPPPENLHRSPAAHLQPGPEREDDEEGGGSGEEAADVKPLLPLCLLGKVVKVSPSRSGPSPSGSAPSAFGRSRSPSPVLRKAPISSLLPVSSPLRAQEHKNLGRGQTTSLTATSRPFWAPQETDAPLNLTMESDADKNIICKLCGAWFETRKGLSSHARAHLRHFGVEYSESRGSPIDLLDRLMLNGDFKNQSGTSPLLSDHRTLHASTTSAAASKRPLVSSSLVFKKASLGSGLDPKATSSSSSSNNHSLFGPPSKKLKTSTQQLFRLAGREMMTIPLAEPLKDVGCEFCGELFENRKGLSSHARSHLRQLGITEWSVNGSPIDTLREVIIRRGLPCVVPLKPNKSPSSCSTSPCPGPQRTTLQPSPSPPGATLSRGPFSFTQHRPTARKMPTSVSAARSSAGVVLVKPKPEPEQVEVTVSGAGILGHDFASDTLHPNSISSDNAHPINLVMTQEREPCRDVRCEFCGEFFENRKGLSSHARSHLRHMGITEWSVNGSPIDTLWEIMRKQGAGGVKEEEEEEDEAEVERDHTAPWEGQHMPKMPRKPSLGSLHPGPRLLKAGLGTRGPNAAAGKFFGISPLGKRLPGAERSPQAQPKPFSPLPQDFALKGKASADKHGVGHMDASCELCGFFFENRKALASHARAHLRQFGVTEWCVNGSPIETLSAWMRSRPQMAAEIHRSYLQGGRSAQRKKSSPSLSSSCDSVSVISSPCPKSAAGHWSALGRALGREAVNSSWSSSSLRASSSSGSFRHTVSAHQHSGSSMPHGQVARSELNVRVPRGVERRPLKHPSHADGGERESCPPKPPRTSTVPALVPKPPSTPLVKLVGKIYSLKCRFCEVEFHGPLSVQEDWIRHLQQHILNLNYSKPASTKPPITITNPKEAAAQTPPSDTTSTSTTTSTTTTAAAAAAPTPASATTHSVTPTHTPTSTAPPTPTPAEAALSPAT